MEKSLALNLPDKLTPLAVTLDKHP